MLYPTSTLLAILLLSQTAHSATPVIIFTHQCQNTAYQAWFDYLTVCFAPLIAHVLGGVASATIVPPNAKEPTWTALLPHFNPISVIWRWYAIADRRLRSYSWNATDMAACNAVFWDSQNSRWDGSEEIMVRSRAWITRIPRLSYVPMVSISSLTTVILTLQGVQAGFLIFASLDPESTQRFAQGLPNVFIPLGCLGLMRLPAAFWLSDDYVFLDASQTRSCSPPNVAEPRTVGGDEAGDALLELDPRTSKRATPTATAVIDPLSTPSSHLSEPTASTKPGLHPINGRVALLYRIWWLVSVTGLLGGSAAATSHFVWHASPQFPYLSLSHLLLNVQYFVITTAGVVITGTYIVRGRTQSTLIPCIHATWYKVFTVVLMAMAAATTIVAALETRQLHDGSLTTLPEFLCNQITARGPVAAVAAVAVTALPSLF